MRGRALTTGYGAVPRSGGRSMGVNNLDGTLPAELGKLTDLEALCAALRRRLRSPSAGPVGAARSRACGGAQRL